MKKNTKTFADRARAIEKKYSRAKFDPIEASDMERELESLMKEQEQYREVMGMNNQEEMCGGGKMSHAGGGPLDDIENYVSNDVATTMSANSNIDIPEITQIKPLQAFWNRNKKYTPSVLSGASNIAGNLILANMANKNKPTYTPTLATPEKINLEPQADQLRKNATVAKNVALRNARNLGVNAGQTLANMGAIGADVDRNLDTNLTNLYMGQEQANVGAANQFNLANMGEINRGNLINMQLDQQALQDKLGYYGAAMSSIPGVMKDINLINADEKTKQMYRNYINSLGRNYFYSGNLFGAVPMNYGVRNYNG